MVSIDVMPVHPSPAASIRRIRPPGSPGVDAVHLGAGHDLKGVIHTVTAKSEAISRVAPRCTRGGTAARCLAWKRSRPAEAGWTSPCCMWCETDGAAAGSCGGYRCRSHRGAASRAHAGQHQSMWARAVEARCCFQMHANTWDIVVMASHPPQSSLARVRTATNGMYHARCTPPI